MTARAAFRGAVRRVRRWIDRACGRQDDYRMAQHYRASMESHMAQSTFYQAELFHAWKCNRQQTKGLQRQAAKILRLKRRIAELTAGMVGGQDGDQVVDYQICPACGGYGDGPEACSCSRDFDNAQ